MENKNQEPFDYEKVKQKVKEQFRTSKSLYGKDGAFAPLLQDRLTRFWRARWKATWIKKNDQPAIAKTGKAKSF